MSQIQAVVKENINKIYILKDKRILILYNNENSTIIIMNQNTFIKEIKYEINAKINDLIILSNGNFAISFNKLIQIFQINKNDFTLVQEIKIQIEKESINYFFSFMELPEFTKAKCAEYKNGKYFLILKRIPFDESKYGLYNYSSIVDIYSLTKKDYYSYTKSVSLKFEIKGKILCNNNYLIIHGIKGANPMTTLYYIYLYDIENEKETKLNDVRYFNEKHELYFISNNKLLHYYIEGFDYFINIYNLENNKLISKKFLKNIVQIKYIFDNEKFIYFLLIEKTEKEKKNEKEENKLRYYKYDYNINLIEEMKSPINIQSGYENVIKIKQNCLLLYGKKQMMFLQNKNLLNNKKEKNLISEIFD